MENHFSWVTWRQKLAQCHCSGFTVLFFFFFPLFASKACPVAELAHYEWCYGKLNDSSLFVWSLPVCLTDRFNFVLARMAFLTCT